MAFNALQFDNNVPLNFNELKDIKNEKLWVDAVNREIKSINDNETWEEVKKPEGVQILDTKQVFTYKDYEDKECDKYKARLVARGFAQNIDSIFSEIYSPVLKMSTLRLILILGNQLKFFFQQLDVKSAFLNDILVESVYIYPPKGIKCEDNNILKLNKSLYGLKQSSKCWNKEVNDFLKELNFERFENDFSLYTLHKEQILLVIYVDDIILCGPNFNNLNKIINKLMSRFKITDKGKLKHFPKLKFDLVIENGKTTEKPFRELVGCLMYLMLGTRPDICYSLNHFSRYQDKATDEAWNYLKRVLRYLKSTKNLGLKFERSMEFKSELICYVDADWASDCFDRKSVTGFIFKFLDCSFLWATRKQNCVSLSTTQAELISLCSAITEALWIKKILNDIKIKNIIVKVYEDNQGCIALIRNSLNNKRVKHIDLKYHFICDNVVKSIIDLYYIDSKNNQADFLTKGLPITPFTRFVNLVGLKE